MKSALALLLLCCLPGPTDAAKHEEEFDTKEIANLLSDPSLSSLIDDPDFLLVLKKRLGGTAISDCRPKEKNETIIKTKESLDNGAIYISTPIIHKRQDCFDKCCDEKECNTAVVKDKVCIRCCLD